MVRQDPDCTWVDEVGGERGLNGACQEGVTCPGDHHAVLADHQIQEITPAPRQNNTCNMNKVYSKLQNGKILCNTIFVKQFFFISASLGLRICHGINNWVKAC